MDLTLLRVAEDINTLMVDVDCSQNEQLKLKLVELRDKYVMEFEDQEKCFSLISGE